MSPEVNKELFILLNVAISAVLTSFIGGEREKSDKPAGLRTNMIVGSVSCFFVSISSNLSNFIESNVGANITSVDPIRILQAIIVGVSFIGAGTILKSGEKSNVLYLTTAATLLYSSGIGIAVALNAYVTAIGLTIIILIINALHGIVAKFRK